MDTLWFRVAVLIFAGFIVGLSIANSVFYNRIRNFEEVSKDTATNMLFVNIITAILAIILLVWAIYRLLSKEKRETVKKILTSKV
jgi:uncharacterized BrkB/YihY/UPF0761 family membrane protein